MSIMSANELIYDNGKGVSVGPSSLNVGDDAYPVKAIKGFMVARVLPSIGSVCGALALTTLGLSLVALGLTTAPTGLAVAGGLVLIVAWHVGSGLFMHGWRLRMVTASAKIDIMTSLDEAAVHQLQHEIEQALTIRHAAEVRPAAEGYSFDAVAQGT